MSIIVGRVHPYERKNTGELLRATAPHVEKAEEVEETVVEEPVKVSSPVVEKPEEAVEKPKRGRKSSKKAE